MVTLVDMDFSSGHVRVHDGLGPLAFSGNTYDGVGKYGGIEAVTETLDVIARPLKLTLSGVDASLVTTTMTETYQNRSCTVYLGILDQTTMTFVATPETVWEGRMDTMQIEIADGSATIKLNCEHRLYREPRIARYTDQDEQLAYSGDTFFNLMYQIPGFRSQWGSVNTNYSGGVGTGSGGGLRPSNPLP
jgi:hypothetical protein